MPYQKPATGSATDKESIKFGILYTTSYWRGKKYDYKPFKNERRALTQRILWGCSLAGIAGFTWHQIHLKNKANYYFNQGDVEKNHKYNDMAKRNIWGIVGGGAILLTCEINFSVAKKSYYKACKKNNKSHKIK